MADVKESAMTQQSDCKWVRALDANGNSIRISKEDLASVVGGLLSRNPSFIETLHTEDAFRSQNSKSLGYLQPNKWYRILKGTSSISTGVINIGNRYHNTPSCTVLFYYSISIKSSHYASKIAGLTNSITKCRISEHDNVTYLDVYISTPLENDFYATISNAINNDFVENIEDVTNEQGVYTEINF